MLLTVDSEGPPGKAVLPEALLSIAENVPTLTSASDVFCMFVTMSCLSAGGLRVGIAEVLDSFDNSMQLAIDSEGPEDIVLPAALLSIAVNDPTCTSASEVF
jgi:hypothetical protein